MSNKWITTKKVIERWIDRKMNKFAAQENTNTHVLKEE